MLAGTKRIYLIGLLASSVLTGRSLSAQLVGPAPPLAPPPLPPNFAPGKIVPLNPQLNPSPFQLPPNIVARTNFVQVRPPMTQLAFDSLLKEANGSVGDTNVHFTFSLTNVSDVNVSIQNVRTSCGCTVASLPGKPWLLTPGTNGQFGVTVDVRGKYGTLTKSVFIDALVGTNTTPQSSTLSVRVVMPSTPSVANAMSDRQKNMQLAMADRQIVFRNDCAKCHSEPAQGKSGAALYTAVCANCHDSPNRATMVPNLQALQHPTNAEHWRRWITSGRPGSLMPAFATSEGGPLSKDQIESLVEYMVQAFPSKQAATANVTVPAAFPELKTK